MLVPVSEMADFGPEVDEAEPRLTARQLARVAERLKELRGSAISQRELARRTGLSAGTIGQIEQGRHEPRLGTLLGPMPSTALKEVREDR
jgi:DNA-binding XRE family transcriptional regulator